MFTMTHITRREFGGLLALGVQAGRLQGATSGVDKIDETLRSGIAQRQIPAAVGMVATDSRILYSGAFGTRDSSGVPVTADSIFFIASMTKAITTVAAMQLVERGTLKLDEPVGKHLPELAKLEVLEGFDRQRQTANAAGIQRCHAAPPAHAYVGFRLRHVGSARCSNTRSSKRRVPNAAPP